MQGMVKRKTDMVQETLMARALKLMGAAGTWQELRQILVQSGLAESLGADGMQDVADAWNALRLTKMDALELAQELKFWAEGGRYETHLQGFAAIPPEMLVARAKELGWFVNHLGSGGVVVNPPVGRPIFIKLLK
jgi:hypothetical protein